MLIHQFHLDTSRMRHNTQLTLAVRERCTQSYVDALAAFRPKRPSMIGLVRLLRIETYASLIQVASERAIQCWNLKRYKDARQVLLTHESAISYAADLERDYEEAIRGRTDRRATEWMEGLNKLVHAQDKESGYKTSLGGLRRLGRIVGRISRNVRRGARLILVSHLSMFCGVSAENVGLAKYNEALLDDPEKIVQGVEDALSHFR